MEIQIISGFLGAGKTTFLNKYLPLLPGKTAVIENEFGEVGLDGALIQADVPVTELSAGCICCSLALDLKEGIREIAERFRPDRIMIEPSGIGKLSDVMSACEKVGDKMDIEITKRIVIVDACDCALFAEEFGQFYSNQIEYANVVFMSNVQDATEEEKSESLACIRQLNPHTVIYDEDFRKLEDEELLAILKSVNEIEDDMPKDSDNDASDIMLTPINQIFSNVTLENSAPMSEEEIRTILSGLKKEEFGYVLRAKGIVPAVEGGNWHFDYTVSKQSYQKAENIKDEINQVVIIGSGLDKRKLRKFVYSFGEE